MISKPILALILVSAIGIANSEQECSFRSDDDAGYKASWVYDGQNKRVQFTIEAKQRLSDNFWTGIGFGRGMQNGDMIVITSVGGRLKVSDRHGVGYSEPPVDQQQDVQNFIGRVENGNIVAQFSRAINTNDNEDKPLEDPTLNNCQYFIFPVSGGSVIGDASKTIVEQHIQTPTTQLICNISRCNGANTQQPQTPQVPQQQQQQQQLPQQPQQVPQQPQSQVPPQQQSQIPVQPQSQVPAQPQTQVPTQQQTFQPQQPIQPQQSTPLTSLGNGNVLGEEQRDAPAATSRIPTTPRSIAGNGAGIGANAQRGPVNANPNAPQAQQPNAAGTGGADQQPAAAAAAGGGSAESACEYSEGKYKAQWYYTEDTKRITFSLTAPLQASRWAGIGFGQQMRGGDMIIVQDTNGQLKVTDRHGVAHSEPPVDAVQNVEAFKGAVNNGLLQATFNRQLNTEDKEDLPIDDPSQNNCQYFIFPVSGGLSDDTGKIQIHDLTPKVKLICNAKLCKRPPGGFPAPGGTEGEQGEGTPKAGAPTPKPSLPNGRIEAGNSTEDENEDENGEQGPNGAIPNGGASNNGSQGQNVGGQNSAVGQQGQNGNEPGQNQPGSEGAAGGSQGGRQCPARQDHSACRTYIDDYLSVVYSRFPKTDVITQKACNLLATHQEGVVLRECCHYLQSQCNRFIDQYIGGISSGGNGGGAERTTPDGHNPLGASTPNVNVHTPTPVPALGGEQQPATPNANPNPNPNPNPAGLTPNQGGIQQGNPNPGLTPNRNPPLNNAGPGADAQPAPVNRLASANGGSSGESKSANAAAPKPHQATPNEAGPKPAN